MAAVVLLFALPQTASAQADPVVPFETDPIAAAGVDGTVWVSELVGDELWIGGTFANVRNHSLLEEPDIASLNLATINLNTGLVGDRTFDVDGPVWAIEYRDRTVWVGGDFDTVDGVQRSRMVAFDAISGQIRTEFEVDIPRGPAVRDIVEQDGWLYVGHDRGLIRLDATTGTIDESFSLTGASSRIEHLDVRGDLIAVGWHDGGGNGSAVFSISTGERLSRNSPDSWDLEFSPDGQRLYVASVDNSGYAYDLSGTELWENGGSAGDAQAIASTGAGVVFLGFHEDWEGNSSRKMAALHEDTGDELDWYVEMDSYWGVHNIELTPQGLVVTGAFENTNALETRRVAIFRPTTPWQPAQPVLLPGDADLSGVVDAADIQATLDHLAGKDVAEFSTFGADTDEDGAVDLLDALLIAQTLQ